MAYIYDRQPLNSRQLITVAQRRSDDAEALCNTGQNKHASRGEALQVSGVLPLVPGEIESLAR